MTDNHTATDSDALKQAFYPAPENRDDWPRWREGLVALRDQADLPERLRDVQAQAWASRAYNQGFIMLWDHELIDHASGAYKVDALLDRAERCFGGYDVVVLWNNYPLSGVDQRNQFDYFDDLPGGRPALKAAVADFHRRGVKVMVDHKPWVPGLPAGMTEAEGFAQLLRDCDLDGLYLDCSSGPSDDLREAIYGIDPGKAFCSEAPARMEPFGHTNCSWLQMTDDSLSPGVYRNRWLDRDALVYESRRYFHDPIWELQRAWMNGGGHCIWENVFGYWAAYSPRYCSWLRLCVAAQRRYADLFIRGSWQPHVGGASCKRVTISLWELDGQRLYTVANRRSHDCEKVVLKLPHRPGKRYVDVITGRAYRVEKVDDGIVHLWGRLDREGINAVLEVDAIDDDLAAFLAAQARRYADADFSSQPWVGEHRKTELAHLLKPVAPATVAAVPAGMCRLPERRWLMETRYRMRECGYIQGHASELHVYDAFEKECIDHRPAQVSGAAIDETPVTNVAFKAFLEATGYRPANAQRFLAHWAHGAIPAGLEQHPVVYVSLNDARAYAAWAGKRLPREEEWQLAAQGTDDRRYPWGNEADTGQANWSSAGTTPVDAFPAGRSPVGCLDLCGNTWEWCESERSDGHTRYAILKGGSFLDHGAGSFWLFDNGPKPADWGAKLILLHDGWDRCSTIGFRCAVDVAN